MPLFHDAFEEDADLDSIEEALKEIRNGRAVIVVDARDRENEGDFICSAELITPELVNFMLRQGGGMLCVPMVEEVSRRLQLGLAAGADTNTTPHQTNFLVQVDHLTAGTGVSAENRARTIKALADPHSNAEDFMRPGHISPLLAKDGGVLRRAGHTEATIDLMRLAGLRPVGALIEILSPTGSGMATLDELKGLAAIRSEDYFDLEPDPLPSTSASSWSSGSWKCRSRPGTTARRCSLPIKSNTRNRNHSR